MDKVAIITDSTGYIPKDLVDKYHLTVIPQVLIWEEKTYLDGWIFNHENFTTA